MKELQVLSLSPFVPSGKDYAASRRLFVELGFEEIWEKDGYAGFRNGDENSSCRIFMMTHSPRTS